MLERAWYEGRGAAALLELSLLRQRADCARARVDAHPRLRARAQSDTGVGMVLMLELFTSHEIDFDTRSKDDDGGSWEKLGKLSLQHISAKTLFLKT